MTIWALHGHYIHPKQNSLVTAYQRETEFLFAVSRTKRRKIGAILIAVFTILIFIVSGLLLLFNAFYQEQISKLEMV